jgi:hypothetical protein
MSCKSLEPTLEPKVKVRCFRHGATSISSDPLCSWPLGTDAVEKVVGMSAVRNNRIIGADFLNGAFAFGACIESILLGDPPQNLFSTASTTRDDCGECSIVS